jgi:hypothetical protein
MLGAIAEFENAIRAECQAMGFQRQKAMVFSLELKPSYQINSYEAKAR